MRCPLEEKVSFLRYLRFLLGTVKPQTRPAFQLLILSKHVRRGNSQGNQSLTSRNAVKYQISSNNTLGINCVPFSPRKVISLTRTIRCHNLYMGSIYGCKSLGNLAVYVLFEQLNSHSKLNGCTGELDISL